MRTSVTIYHYVQNVVGSLFDSLINNFLVRMLACIAFFCNIAYPSAVGAVFAEDIVVGVNVTGMGHMTLPQQDEVLATLRVSGIHFIRAGISDDQNGLDFARRAYGVGIKILWNVQLSYLGNAPKRRESEMTEYGVWQSPPLSYADPAGFKAAIGPQLQMLEQAGVVLAGFELGNEVNAAAFNGDFSLPGHGQLFGSDELARDLEGQAVARGYLQYLKTLAAMKEIRDHSHLNRQTPIISAGLTMTMPPGSHPEWKTDGVALNTTIRFWRQNGIDGIVDAYGVHAYPWANDPGLTIADAARKSSLNEYVLAECGRTSGGKPCWITEWGFPYEGSSCPPGDEPAHVALVRNMMANFWAAARLGKIQGLFYYTWNIDPWQKKLTSKWTIYRCARLTDSGRIATNEALP